MKILYLTNAYNDFINQVSVQPQLTYEENERNFFFHSFSWADFWVKPMRERGVEFWQTTANHTALLKLWERDYLPLAESRTTEDILVEQARRFQPDILFIDHYDIALLARLVEACPTIKIKASWTGSAIAPRSFLKLVDVVLSCAPEAVLRLNQEGIPAQHLNHLFAPEVLTRMGSMERPQSTKCTFIGQVIPSAEFHRIRFRQVCKLVPMGLDVYSPKWHPRMHINFLKQKVLSNIFSDISVPDYLRFHKNRRDPCFGLQMYKTLANSAITLNIHADSSPQYASNMRLFEATGVGTCLLTDWKENLNQLFEPDSEIVTYKSFEECLDKLRYLIENPRAAKQISLKGQQRCLRDHTIDSRADKMLEIFKKYI